MRPYINFSPNTRFDGFILASQQKSTVSSSAAKKPAAKKPEVKEHKTTKLAKEIANFVAKTEIPTTQTTSSSVVTSTTVPKDVQIEEKVTSSPSNYTEPILYLRTRNISFEASGLKPSTRHYASFGGIDVTSFIVPKLLEIKMISGSFETGEIVESDATFTSNFIRFRLCYPKHTFGPYNDDTFNDGRDNQDVNPYTGLVTPFSYTNSSDFLNIDIRSLQLPTENFYGSVSVGMRLIGKTSGAVAEVSNLRLVTDTRGILSGSLFIPDPNKVGNPKFITQMNAFALTDIETFQVGSSSFASTDYAASGTTNVTENNILTTRTITITPPYDINTTTITNNITITTPQVTIDSREEVTLQNRLKTLKNSLSTLNKKSKKSQLDKERITSLTNEIALIEKTLTDTTTDRTKKEIQQITKTLTAREKELKKLKAKAKPTTADKKRIQALEKEIPLLKSRLAEDALIGT